MITKEFVIQTKRTNKRKAPKYKIQKRNSIVYCFSHAKFVFLKFKFLKSVLFYFIKFYSLIFLWGLNKKETYKNEFFWKNVSNSIYEFEKEMSKKKVYQKFSRLKIQRTNKKLLHTKISIRQGLNF